MTLRHFGRLAGAEWDLSFRAKLGKAASKLYREIYGKDPPQTRASILEQACRQLTAESQSSAGSTSKGYHTEIAASVDARR
jgi:hypothetical protein